MNINANQYFYIIYKKNYKIEGQHQIIYQYQSQGYNMIFAKALSNCTVTSDFSVSVW
jgi:tyrosine-protein phosphatase YwqE